MGNAPAVRVKWARIADAPMRAQTMPNAAQAKLVSAKVWAEFPPNILFVLKRHAPPMPIVPANNVVCPYTTTDALNEFRWRVARPPTSASPTKTAETWVDNAPHPKAKKDRHRNGLVATSRA